MFMALPANVGMLLEVGPEHQRHPVCLFNMPTGYVSEVLTHTTDTCCSRSAMGLNVSPEFLSKKKKKNR